MRSPFEPLRPTLYRHPPSKNAPAPPNPAPPPKPLRPTLYWRKQAYQ
jgi:hypothetical protein